MTARPVVLAPVLRLLSALAVVVASAGAIGCGSDPQPGPDGDVGAERSDAGDDPGAPVDALPDGDVGTGDTGDGVADGDGAGPDGDGGPALTFGPCSNSRFECGTVTVPLDHAQPELGTVEIQVARAPALRPADRLGVLLFNPGGPGVETVDRAGTLHPFLVQLLPEVALRFDVIFFDWRGVGLSEPIDCVDDGFLDAARAGDISPVDAAGLSALDQLATDFAAGCTSGTGEAFLRNLHTENAARDLDRIREALGEEQISYLGISYGTHLGATYATLFPDRLRAFVLDSPVAPTGPSTSRFDVLEGQMQGYEVSLERFFVACAADAACPFHGGTDAAELRAAWDTLYDQVAVAPLTVGPRNLNELDIALAALNTLRGADHTGLATALADLEIGDGTALLALADAEIGRLPDGTYVHFFEPLMAIACLDNGYPEGTTVAEVDTFATQLAASYPRMARALFSPWYLCARWPYARAAVPVSAPTAPPLLLVAGRYDPATPFAGAGALQTALGNGSYLLTYEGEGHGHLLHSPCVRAAEQAFLIDPGTPPSPTTCAAP